MLEVWLSIKDGINNVKRSLPWWFHQFS
jgi:hypothetical protein